MNKLSKKLHAGVEVIYDFPQKGIIFRDLQSILSNVELRTEVNKALIEAVQKEGKIDAIAGLESRGFMFGMVLADALGVPFIMVRKPGKLPPPVVSVEYMKEYGPDTLEIREGQVSPGQRIHIHDDLLATGGTAHAAKQLIEKLGATVSGYSFIMDLPALDGKNVLGTEAPITTLVEF